MSKHQGDVAELCFLYEAAKRGLSVSVPFGDNQKYDCVVDTVNGFKKVQIKSTSFYDSKKKKYGIKAANGCSKKEPYDSSDVDIIAINIIPLNLWYFVPIEKLTNISMGFYPYTKKGKWEPYRDRWEIFLSDE